MDSLKGGSGESFDWQQLRPPLELCTSGWLLAGGLGPHNVAGTHMLVALTLTVSLWSSPAFSERPESHLPA